LSVQVSRIAKHSDNFAAELLLKEVGYVVRGRGSSAAGATAVHDTLAAFRVDTGVTADGSGLSTYDRKSVGSEVALLRAAERTAFYDVYRAALPIACVDGTLQHRLCASATRQRTSAKTGTLDTSRALTGWTTTADGHRVRFAFVLTSFTDGLKARAAIDRAVLVLASASVR
jgi:D-alanyl-D-alanine carboxypeptidase/D-alanyl-D-alanine-endopeptidase (penicillin-binding protein 4)